MAGGRTAPEQMSQDDWRAQILADPGLILEDPELMRALVQTSERALGANVVDLRGMAMDRLEARLVRLEDTHRAVISAAYENLSSTNQIHRALIKMLDAEQFEQFILLLGTEVAQVLRVERVRLVLESIDTSDAAGLGSVSSVLKLRGPGFVDHYMSFGRNQPARPIVLRQGVPMSDAPYEDASIDLRSEALMRLDLGPGRLPGLLAMGCEDPHRFKPGQGTDLLAFFTGVFERVLRRWLG